MCSFERRGPEGSSRFGLSRRDVNECYLVVLSHGPVSMLHTLLNLQLSVARLFDLIASLHISSLVILLFHSNTAAPDADFAFATACVSLL